MKRTILALAALLMTAFVALAADATGTWKAEIPGRGGNTTTTTFVLKASGDTLTGSINGGRGDNPISEGKVNGDTITFVQEIAGRDGASFKISYTGKVSADHIDFTRDTGRGTPQMFTAMKQ